VRSPILKLKTHFDISDALSGLEYEAWARLMKEVFDDDVAMPYGEERFSWDSVNIPGKQTY
jgi:hypothetical protein